LMYQEGRPTDKPSTVGGQITNTMTNKAEEIRRILSEPVVDLWKLRELALTEGGLVNDSLRKLAWPKLVGVSNDGIASSSGSSNEGQSSPPPTSEVTVPPSFDAEQIERDVSRVTWHLLTGNQRSRNFQMRNKHRKRISQLLKKKQRRLGDFLNLTLVQSYGDGVKYMKDVERLRYYQGFHDVGSIVLSTLGGASLPISPALTTNTTETTSCPSDLELAQTAADSTGMTLACQVLLQISQQHLRDPMRADFLQLQAALKLVLMPLIAAFDGEMHSHLYDCDMEPFFAISWIITWFSHDVRDTAVVKRLFDFFLVSHPMMPIYMSVAMTIHPLNRIEVLSTDCDFACVHNALANLPKNSNDVGWKYIPGDVSCYVDNDDDDMSVVSMDPSLQGTDDDSVVSAVNHKARVPFQELIDLSVTLMHKIPPRNIIKLAQRYHNSVTLQPLLAESSSIALLQPPPSWGLTSNTDSDWVIRARMLKEQGTKLNRHQRKNRKKLANGTDYINDNESSCMSMVSTIYPEKGDKPPLQAVIASGTGPDGRAEARKLRKKRKALTQSVVVIVISIFALTAKSYFFSTPVQQQLPVQNQISVDEESRSFSDVALDESKKHEPATIVSDDRQPDQTKAAVSSEDKRQPDQTETVTSSDSEGKLHVETMPVNQKVKSQLNDDYPSMQNENEDVPTNCDIVRNEVSDTETQHLVVSTSITAVSPNRSEQLARAIGRIKAAVEDEISFECKGSARTAAAAQEIWRKQANNIKTQGERLLNFSKERLSQESRNN